MMYHFMFGLVFSGGGPCSPSGGVALMFCSVMLANLAFRCFLPYAVVQHPIHATVNHIVNNEKKYAEKNHGDDHHRRSRLDLFPAGKRNFPHLIADVSEKALYAVRNLR